MSETKQLSTDDIVNMLTTKLVAVEKENTRLKRESKQFSTHWLAANEKNNELEKKMAQYKELAPIGDIIIALMEHFEDRIMKKVSYEIDAHVQSYDHPWNDNK